MNLPNETWALVAICAIVMLLSVAGLAWAFVTGLAFTMDGLLLILICLLMGGIFSLMLFWMARDAGWLARLPRLRSKAQAGESVAKQADHPAGQGK